MSFRASLEEHFGERSHPDYGNRPMNKSAPRRNAYVTLKGLDILARPPRGMSCIHGHFMPAKYRYLRNADFVTWLRDPVERLASQYFFWKRTYNSQTVSLMQRRLVEEDCSFERFCLGEEFRNFYSQYLWHFPLQRFRFIGITEHYDDDLRDFSRMVLGTEFAPHATNRNPEGSHSYFQDPVFRYRVEEHNRKDMDLYRRALDMRATRRSQ